MTTPTAGPVLWRYVPTWYLVAEYDRMIVLDTQRSMAERMNATFRSHAVDHAPIITASGRSSTLFAKQSARSPPEDIDSWER